MRITRPVLDTSALNWFKIRKSKGSHIIHPLTRSGRTDLSGSCITVKNHEICEVSNILSTNMIAGSVQARRLVECGRVRLGTNKESKNSLFSPENVFLDGHTIEELRHSHCAVYKPAGISSVDECRSLLPFPSMFFGYKSGLERSCSGLVLLINNTQISRMIERSNFERVYYVTVSGDRPLSPKDIIRLKAKTSSEEIDCFGGIVSTGSCFSLRMKIRGAPPNKVRSIFNSLGFDLQECRLMSIGNVSLEKVGLKVPKSFKFLSIEEIIKLLL